MLASSRRALAKPGARFRADENYNTIDNRNLKGEGRIADTSTAAARTRGGRTTGERTGQPARRARGRPRDERLDAAILDAAERQLREHGYGGMSLESVARAAATTVPSLRRRYGSKAELAAAVVDSLRIDPLSLPDGPPRQRALAILENFQRNLGREHSMALLGTLLAEESRTPELLERFRSRLLNPRRAMLTEAVKAGVTTGELPADTDPDVAVNALIGSFYARYVAFGRTPRNWPRRALEQIWPARPARATRPAPGDDARDVRESEEVVEIRGRRHAPAPGKGGAAKEDR